MNMREYDDDGSLQFTGQAGHYWRAALGAPEGSSERLRALRAAQNHLEARDPDFVRKNEFLQNEILAEIE